MAAETITNTQTVDVVGVFTSTLTQLFPQARPIKATITEMYKPMEHPMESGSVTTDHKVLQPVEIEMPVMLTGDNYVDTYKAIKTAAASKSLLTVMTRVGAFENMTIIAWPHEESTDIYDGVSLALKMKEVILVTAQFQALPPRKVSNQKDTSVLDRGEQTTEKSSVGYRLFYGSDGKNK